MGKIDWEKKRKPAGFGFSPGDRVWKPMDQRFRRRWVGRVLESAKQNAVGAWVFGKHARRPPWWREEICRRRPLPADQVALRPGSRFPNSSANALKRNAGGHAGVGRRDGTDLLGFFRALPCRANSMQTSPPFLLSMAIQALGHLLGGTCRYVYFSSWGALRPGRRALAGYSSLPI